MLNTLSGKEMETEMLEQKKRQIWLAGLFTLATLPLLGIFIPSPTAHAQGESLEQIIFSKQTNDSIAKTQAENLYKKYLRELDPSYRLDFEALSVPAYARFIPLNGSGTKKFIAYYRYNGPDGECYPLGCDFTIFKEESAGQWHTVLSVATHEVWVGETSQDGTPRDIFLKSFGLAPWKDEGVGLWRWKNGKYEFANRYKP